MQHQQQQQRQEQQDWEEELGWDLRYSKIGRKEKPKYVDELRELIHRGCGVDERGRRFLDRASQQHTQ